MQSITKLAHNTKSTHHINSVIETFKYKGYKWDVVEMVKLPNDFYPMGAVNYKCVQRGGKKLELMGPGIRIGQGFPGIGQWFKGVLRAETRNKRLRPAKTLWIDIVGAEYYVAGGWYARGVHGSSHRP
jgi:hypothetical protein